MLNRLVEITPHSSAQTLTLDESSSCRVATNTVSERVSCENESLPLHYNWFHRRNQRQEVESTTHHRLEQFPAD